MILMDRRGEPMSVKVSSVNREISGGPRILLSILIISTLLCLLLVTSEFTSGLYCSTMDVDSYLLYICFCSKSDAIIKTAFFGSVGPLCQQSDSRSIGCVRKRLTRCTWPGPGSLLARRRACGLNRWSHCSCHNVSSVEDCDAYRRAHR